MGRYHIFVVQSRTSVNEGGAVLSQNHWGKPGYMYTLIIGYAIGHSVSKPMGQKNMTDKYYNEN